MKKIYLLLILFSVCAFSQNVTITKIIETGCSSPFVKTVELYVDGTVDFANDDIVLNYMQNGAPWSANQIDISALGVQTDSFVYIVRDIPLMEDEFPSTTFDASNTVIVGSSTNGDDGYQIVFNGVVISQFGETETDGTGEAWEHKDAVATRLDGIPDTGTFDITHWDFTALQSTDDFTFCENGAGNSLEAWFNTLGGTFPLGSGSGWTPSCTTFIGDDAVICDSQSTGANDDTYTATLDFTGANNGNIFAVNSTNGTIGGDDPSSVETGTIIVSNIPEGTDISISISDIADGGSCDLTRNIESPGCVPLVLNETLFDPPSGLDGDANNDGTRDNLEDEFIEFFNNSSSSLDISGYTIADASQLRHTFPPSTVVPANGAVVVFGGGTPTGSFGTAIVQTASEGSLALNNAGDKITVENASGQVVIEFDSGEVGLDFGDNQSITRNPDITGNYDLHTNANPALLFSPGLQVDGQTLSVEDNVFTNDIVLYPNPVSNGQLFIKTKSQIENVKIYSLLGKQVFEKSSSNNLDLNNLQTGVYIIKIKADGNQISKKLILK